VAIRPIPDPPPVMRATISYVRNIQTRHWALKEFGMHIPLPFMPKRFSSLKLSLLTWEDILVYIEIKLR
jgi:hypothetical protein